jgi:hypothetical protein
MIVPSGAMRVLVATRPVDFRNYAERTIMLSPGGERAAGATRRWFLLGIIF